MRTISSSTRQYLKAWNRFTSIALNLNLSSGLTVFFPAKTYSDFIWCVVSFKVPESELELSTNIAQAWDDLFMESRRVDASLVSVKKKFTEVSFIYM